MKKEKTLNIICNILFIAYLITTFLVVMSHEPWMDEAQSWLIARHYSVPEIWSYMKYEGHSCLWHLILKIFIELKFSYAIVNFIPWVITSLTAIIFYFFADFKKSTKIILLFTPVALYFSIFARPYAIYFSLMLLLLMVYRTRHQHPFIYGLILALIANTHVLTLGFVGSLILIDLYEIVSEGSSYKKEKITSIVLAAIGILIFALQVIGATSARSRFFSDLSNRFLINFFYLFLELFNSLGYYGIVSGLILILFFIIMHHLFKDKKMFTVALLSLFFQITFLTLFYFCMSDYHATIFFMIVIFCLCLSPQKNKKTITLVILFCLLTIPHSLHLLNYDFKNDYSNTKNIALYLKENAKQGDIILHGTSYVTIFPYFAEDELIMYSLNSDERLYLNDFAEKEVALNDEEVIYAELERLNADYFIYYVAYYGLPDEVEKIKLDSDKLELIIDNEKAQLYKYKK